MLGDGIWDYDEVLGCATNLDHTYINVLCSSRGLIPPKLKQMSGLLHRNLLMSKGYTELAPPLTGQLWYSWSWVQESQRVDLQYLREWAPCTAGFLSKPYPVFNNKLGDPALTLFFCELTCTREKYLSPSLLATGGKPCPGIIR